MKAETFHGEVWLNAHEEILHALLRANHNPIDGGYGTDSESARATLLMQKELGTSIHTTFAINGTAANVMALKAMLGRCDAIICAEQTHINTYEAGAFEYNLGNKILSLAAHDGKLTPRLIEDLLLGTKKYHYNPKVIAMAQPTEFGTVYTADEIRAICDFAHTHGMYVYVDGARIGNAAAALKIGLKEMLADTGVDAFSFGGTKAGALFGEMIVFMRKEFDTCLKYSQKQSLQHMSKSKFLGVQMATILEKELWLTMGEASNKMAKKLEQKLKAKGVAIRYKVQSNMVFCAIPPERFSSLCQTYDMHYWDEFTHTVRLATTYLTTEQELDALVALL